MSSEELHGTTKHNRESVESEKIAEMKDSFFPGDWDDEDIEFLAEFLSHYNLGELGRILDPANEYDYHLYTDAENDEDVKETTDPLEVLPESTLDTPGTEFSNLPRGTGRDLGGELDE